MRFHQERTPLTQSSLRVLGTCEEKYRLRYIERRRNPVYKPALSIGRAFHLGIEAQSPDAAEAAILEGRGAAWSEAEAEDLIRSQAIVRAMVSGALARWTEWPDPVDREVPFRLPLRNPHTGAPSTRHVLAGVIDGVFPALPPVRPVPVLLEIKTTSRLDAAYIQRLALDFQVSAYCHAASHLYGLPVREVVYRVVRKPSIRQKKDETADEFADRVLVDYTDRPEFYFVEEIVTRTDAELERWWWEAWEIHRRVLRLEAGEMSVRNTQHCLDFGRCDYFDVCRGAVDIDTYTLLDNPHPELPPEGTKR